MPVLGSLEKGLQRAADWVFRRGGVVEIPELTTRLEKELDTEAQLLNRDRWLVPNYFHIGLSAVDYARLFPLSRTMTEEITHDLLAYAEERSYAFTGQIQITYEERADLPTGRFSVHSETVADVAQPRSVAGAARGELVLEVNGVRHPLTEGSFVIGRGHDAQVTVNDPGMSREHAQITVTNSAGGRTITLADLGSRNGVFLNGQRVQEASLAEGDRIRLGNTDLTILAAAGR